MPPKEDNGWPAVLLLVAIGGSAVGVLFYQNLQRQKAAAPADKTGFDLSQVDEKPRRIEAPASVPAKAPASSLGMATIDAPGVEPPQPALHHNIITAPPAFSTLARASESKVMALTVEFRKRYPVISQYEKEWLSHPELKKLNDDYYRNHDPAAFLQGLAASPSFGGLVKKYATQKPMQEWFLATLRASEPGTISAATDYLGKNNNIKALADNVMGALGLPPGLLGDPTAAQKIDPKAILNSVMQNNPRQQ